MILKGIEPEIRTYNTVIIACNMSGQATEALKVYERMLRAGADPTATTYTALISAYGKNGQLDRALQIFEDMVRYHLSLCLLHRRDTQGTICVKSACAKSAVSRCCASVAVSGVWQLWEFMV